MFDLEARGDVLDLLARPTDELPSLGDFSHPVTAYLNSLAPSSRRPQLSALDWIARRAATFHSMLDLGFFSATARMLIDRATQAAARDPRIVGLTLGGSAVAGGIDEFSDLDFVVVCHDEDQPALLAEARPFAQRLGQLLASFTGEHLSEPRLLICLYGPPLLHVDLK